MADDRQAALNAIDLKGNIVLKEFGDTALLFRPQNNYEPFVVAYGYDKAAGEWSHGSYHTDLGHAFEEANPEIIEGACVRWQRGDIATALGNEEYPATDANVSWILNRSTMGDFHEEMTAKGNERLGEIVHEQERYLDKASGKNLEHPPRPVRAQQLLGLSVRMRCDWLLRRSLGCTADQCASQLHCHAQQRQR